MLHAAVARVPTTTTMPPPLPRRLLAPACIACLYCQPLPLWRLPPRARGGLVVLLALPPCCARAPALQNTFLRDLNCGSAGHASVQAARY